MAFSHPLISFHAASHDLLAETSENFSTTCLPQTHASVRPPNAPHPTPTTPLTKPPVLSLRQFHHGVYPIDIDLNTTTTLDIKAIAYTFLEAEMAKNMRVLRNGIPYIRPQLWIRWSGSVLDEWETLGDSGIIHAESMLHAEINPFRIPNEWVDRRKHYEPEPRTRYVSKGRRRAERAMRAEMGSEAQVKGEMLESEQKQQIPSRIVRNNLERVEKVESGDETLEAEDESAEETRSMSEPPYADERSDEEQDVDANIEDTTNNIREEASSAAQNKEEDGECIEVAEQEDVQAVEGLYDQGTEAQPAEYPVEVEEGELVEMKWQPDPFATEDEDKENWDPRFVPQLFAPLVVVPEDNLTSEMWSIFGDEQWMRGGALSIGSSSHGL